jgi:hypothetical protein
MKTLLAFLVLTLAAIPGWTQEKTVGGLVINLGLMPAAKAMQVGGHREAHEHAFTNSTGAEHLLVVVVNAKTGERRGDARVVVEVRDPKGKIERKVLLRTQAAGLPDYSEIFQFGWSGKYTVRVSVTPKPGAKPVEARFTVNHSI